MQTLATPSIVNGSFASQTTPEQVTISEDLKSLNIRLGTGQTIVLKAERLRAACRCAFCLRARIDEVFPTSFEGLDIAYVAPMGHYGINIAFSDGHARGIFPWSYLATFTDTDAPVADSQP
jgi:prepilin-type processing-associated H-X9-DG protein